MSNRPDDNTRIIARKAIEAELKSYGFTGDINTAIDLLCRAARTLAPRTAESALDTGNTDHRPEGGRKAEAWDLVAVAHALNGFSV